MDRSCCPAWDRTRYNYLLIFGIVYMMNMLTRLIALAWFLMAAAPRLTQADSPLVPQPIPDGLGVNIHFTHPQPGEMKMLADSGIRWIRMDFDWEGTELGKGNYDFSNYDSLLKDLDEYHIRGALDPGLWQHTL